MSIFQSIARLFGGGGTTLRSTPQVSAPVPPPPRKPAAPPPRETPAARRVFNRLGGDFATVEIPASADIAVDLSGNSRLSQLPSGIRTGSLNLSGCTTLSSLPAEIDVAFLDLSGCTALKELPQGVRLRGGRLNLSGCTGLTSLPDDLGEVAALDLSGCTGISQMPQGLVVTSWIDVADSGIKELPELFEPVGVRWNGVAVPRKVAFAPQSITRDDVARERDPKVREIMEQRAA